MNLPHLFCSFLFIPRLRTLSNLQSMYQEPPLLAWKKRIPNPPLRGFCVNERMISPLDGGIKKSCPSQVEESENNAPSDLSGITYKSWRAERAGLLGLVLLLCIVGSRQWQPWREWWGKWSDSSHKPMQNMAALSFQLNTVRSLSFYNRRQNFIYIFNGPMFYISY